MTAYLAWMQFGIETQDRNKYGISFNKLPAGSGWTVHVIKNMDMIGLEYHFNTESLPTWNDAVKYIEWFEKSKYTKLNVSKN